jgi:hypothetical protein
MKRFKSVVGIITCFAMVVALGTVQAQKLDEERMRRDIEVAENVLSTLIKQQFNNQRTFFPLEVHGSYQPGYGVTFTLPADFTTPIVFSMPSENDIFILGDDMEDMNHVRSYSYRYEIDNNGRVITENISPGNDTNISNNNTYRLKDKNKEKKRQNLDSTKNEYNKKVVEAAKMFVVDYGDMISQLAANEKIIVTNQGNQPRQWVNQYFDSPKRTHLSVEALKSDLTAFRSGKLSRDQALSKVTVVNTETVAEVEADLELLTTMFNRLYRVDLSKTFFTEDNIYYERLKDFGAIYYMNVFSSDEIAPQRFNMPTIGLMDVDLETRNKKIKDMYSQFEKELKENILEYGRTVKSLKDNEALVFQVRVTRCPSCGIPSTLEYTVKGSTLKDYNNGKIDRSTALSKVTVKKGANQ